MNEKDKDSKETPKGTKKRQKRYVQTLVELAELLGITRQRLDQLRAIDGSPKSRPDGRHDVHGWLSFAAQHSAKVADSQNPTKRELEARRLEIQCRKLLFELEVEQGKYIEIEQAEREITQMVTASKTLLRAKFENELPPQLEGLPAAQIQKLCKAAIDDVLTQLSK